MGNKLYNKDILEAVTQGLVGGEPARSLIPFRLAKTTIFIIALFINNSFSSDLEDELISAIKEFNQVSPFKLQTERTWPTKEEAEAKEYHQAIEELDVALNKAEIREGRYWVDGRWIIRKDSNYKKVAGGWIYIEDDENKVYLPAKSEQELIDSDNDGYDDYTEYTNGTNPKDNREIPAVRNGNNKVTFKMDGCKAGFQFPSITKDVLPIGVMSNGSKILNDNK